MSASDRPLDAMRLLGIDVREELHKVPGAAVASDAQLPVEIVRWLVSRGARALAILLARGRVEVVAPGAAVDSDTLLRLSQLRDAAASPALRHAALTALERDDPFLLALAGTASERLLVEDPASGMRLDSRPRHAHFGVPRPGVAAQGLRVVLSARNLRAPAARQALREACRHASLAVSLDGAALPRGFAEPLYVGRLPAPLPGVWSVAVTGEVTRVALLVHGIVAGHATLAGVPGLRVALEVPAPGGGAAAAREAFGPLRVPLEHALRTGLVAAGARLPQLPEDAARRVRRLLLDIAASHRQPALLSLPLLPAWRPEGLTHLTLRDLSREAEQARAAQRAVPALFPGDAPGAFVLHRWPVWQLDAADRAILGRLASARFEPPPRRARAGRAARLEAWLRRAARRLVAGAGPGGHSLPETALRGEERALLAALREAEPGLRPALTDGVTPPSQWGSRLVLARRHPDVRLALQALRSRPDEAYAALLALGRPSGAAARERWRAALALAEP